MGQGWLESEDEYQKRISLESNEATIERLTGSAPKRGWLETEADYALRIKDEAHEAILSDSGETPSQGWLESSADYRSRIERESHEFTISRVTGETPAQGWLESAEDYDRRIREESDRATLESLTGESPAPRLFESNRDYRHRLSTQAREAKAEAAETADSGDKAPQPSTRELPVDAPASGHTRVARMSSDDPLINEGEVLAKRGSYEAAERKFSAAVAQSPNSARPYLYRADNRADMRDFTGALADIDVALRLTKRPVAVRWIRATIFVRMGRFDDAANDYTVAVERGYEIPKALNRRASCYYKSSRFFLAAEDYRRLLELEPHEMEHLERLALMYHLAGKTKQAVRELDSRMHWFRDRYGLKQLRREFLEEQSLWDRLFG